jgi:cell division protein FtsB
MDATKIVLVVCITLAAVAILNAVIFAALRRGNEAGQIELLQRAVRRTRQPWQSEDDALKELSKRVEALKKKDANDEQSNHH